MAEIEKADAAERLIISAVTMVDRGDDPLATHLVATSALNILRDLMRQVDQEYVTEVIKLGMFTLAHAEASGKPVDLDVPQQASAQIAEIAAAIAAGTVTGPDDLGVADKTPWEMLDYITGPSNFLKHADRDPSATLDEARFDPVGAIAHAITAYTRVRPDHPIAEPIKTFIEKHGIS